MTFLDREPRSAEADAFTGTELYVPAGPGRRRLRPRRHVGVHG
jgi:hypothetical protein